MMSALQILKDKDYPTAEGNCGFFGYQSAAAHRAMQFDDAQAMAAIIQLGWVNAQTKTLDNLSMRQVCEQKGAQRCAALFA
jgi:hypothetical protein